MNELHKWIRLHIPTGVPSLFVFDNNKSDFSLLCTYINEQNSIYFAQLLNTDLIV